MNLVLDTYKENLNIVLSKFKDCLVETMYSKDGTVYGYVADCLTAHIDCGRGYTLYKPFGGGVILNQKWVLTYSPYNGNERPHIPTKVAEVSLELCSKTLVDALKIFSGFRCSERSLQVSIDMFEVCELGETEIFRSLCEGFTKLVQACDTKNKIQHYSSVV